MSLIIEKGDLIIKVNICTLEQANCVSKLINNLIYGNNQKQSIHNTSLPIQLPNVINTQAPIQLPTLHPFQLPGVINAQSSIQLAKAIDTSHPIQLPKTNNTLPPFQLPNIIDTLPKVNNRKQSNQITRDKKKFNKLSKEEKLQYLDNEIEEYMNRITF